ncbi:unnamed protein product [Brachionus calyciflorus]|uniref:FLYWCH-type domain-containing protein n=1 Tax=Brachionus calyciflorus TaxID=104777 RepID=A0A813UWT5_9BILA|nr:unnamed protein product [Brachionus calyciflorus]
MNLDSPITSRLRSNANFQPTSLKKPKRKPRQVKQISYDQVEKLVDEICSVPQVFDIPDDDNYLNKIAIDDNIDENSVKINKLETSEINEEKKIDKLVFELNNLAIKSDMENHTWELFKTQKKGYKVFSLGFTYTIDKPKLSEVEFATKIYWKCTSTDCKARAISNGLIPPLKMTQVHNHLMNPSKLDYLNTLEKIKHQALNSDDKPRAIIRKAQVDMSIESISLLKKTAVRQIIQRTRNKQELSGFNAKCLSQLEIPNELSFTYIKKNFLFADSGINDKNRTFTDWYCDGTFDISPTLFKQVYTIHIKIDEIALPMVYILLPNKKQATYKKAFKLVSKSLSILPSSINMDFEIAAINAAKSVFSCKIHGCFFHLSQSLWRQVQTRGLVKNWYEENFRLSFKRIQALAFIPLKDVYEGFEYVKSISPQNLNPIISYFESNYVGRLKMGNRISPRFPKELWNVFDRVNENLPRTNNDVESWHSRIKPDTRQNLTVGKLFPQEQSFMESNLVSIFQGSKNKKKITKAQLEKNQ